MKLIVPLILFFALLSLDVRVFAQSASADGGNEEYRVYDAAIEKMFAGEKVTFDTQAKIKQIIIRDHTTTDYAYGDKKENWEQIKIRLPNLSEETVANYEAKLKSPIEFKQPFNLALKYSLFSKKDYEAIFGAGRNANSTEDRWSKFYEKYPQSGGYIWLSNVGFNKARDQALVYFVHWCGTLCGTGHYILLKRDEKGWQVETIGMIWIS